jgi:putative membrane protein
MLLLLTLSAAVYLIGVQRSGLSSRAETLWPRLQVGAFMAGWAILFVALVSPLHQMGSVLFSAHMVQHELLMLIAAPLLVLGRPEIMFLWALPRSIRKRIVTWRHFSPAHSLWRAISTPSAAWILHAIALWAWHAPVLFNASVRNEWVHFLQHGSFLGTALLFWWALFSTHLGQRVYGQGLVYIFTTAIHSSILGALLTFAPHAWYSVYEGTTTVWGFTALEDQQLGGLIMWIPAGTIYILAGLALFAAWMRDSERRVSSAEGVVVSLGGNH